MKPYLPPAKVFEGLLFDIYHVEEQIHLWIRLDSGKMVTIKDIYHPILYLRAPEHYRLPFVERLRSLGALHREPAPVWRRLYYENRVIKVTELEIARPSVLRRIRKKLYAMYRKMDLYHSDIELTDGYMNWRSIHPLGRVRITTQPGMEWLKSIESLDSLKNPAYSVPSFRILRLSLPHSHRMKLTDGNPLLVESDNNRRVLPWTNPRGLILALNDILQKEDPDVILTYYGDQTILPALFQLSSMVRLPVHLDREERAGYRRIVRKGSSYMSYGSWIYRAPSYPLFGRWHIDTHNSFVFKEANLAGVIELARVCRVPVQRMARSSTGAALTSIETHVALSQGYLVPWQKSAVEHAHSALDLLRSDRGGLVFLPDTRNGFLYENVAQMDFSQMYPTIMNIHNISPETVLCSCCKKDAHAFVPAIGYHICHRRRGVVADSLQHLLERRKYYKLRIKELEKKIAQMQSKGETEWLEIKQMKEEINVYTERQNSLKWMLVTSFGYLGYRNAKFGRIESHESVTAFGRENLLTAKEVVEEAGFHVLHAITDCLFIQQGKTNSAGDAAQIKRNSSEDVSISMEERVLELTQAIGKRTGVEMSFDGVYSWLIFLPSRQDEKIATANRYVGRFRDGKMKYRGVAARRSDFPPYIRHYQEELLEVMGRGSTPEEVRQMHHEIHLHFRKYAGEIRNRRVKWGELLLRKTISQALEDYSTYTGTSEALRDMQKMGMDTQAGEKVKYIVLPPHEGKKRHNYMSEEEATRRELLQRQKSEVTETSWCPDSAAAIEELYDTAYYEKVLFFAYRELWIHFAPAGYFTNEPRIQDSLFHMASQVYT